MLMEAETWVALAFVLFVGLLGYLGVHRVITKSLDDRAARIKAELDEARKLKDEAAELLAEYQRKRQAAEGEAQDIISGAKAEAERMAAEAKTRIEDFVARRTKMAETKIAQAKRRLLPTFVVRPPKRPSRQPRRFSVPRRRASSQAI